MEIVEIAFAMSMPSFSQRELPTRLDSTMDILQIPFQSFLWIEDMPFPKGCTSSVSLFRFLGSLVGRWGGEGDPRHDTQVLDTKS